MIHFNILVKIIIIATIIFILSNYFVKADAEKNTIKNIVAACITSEMDEKQINKLYRLKQEYIAKRFNLILTRSLVFGIILYFAIKYFDFSESDIVVSEHVESKKLYDDIPF